MLYFSLNLKTRFLRLTNVTRNAKFSSIGQGKGLIEKKEKAELFDEWPEKYDQWFSTPIGALVKKYEVELILDLLKPSPGETILDAGCGTGVFTLDILASGAHVIGMDISLPMLRRAALKARKYPFQKVLADISSPPFSENVFDKAVSVTALEFIEDAKAAIIEIFRVTKRGGIIVVATLNSLSPWATRRRAEAQKGHALFQKAIFRSPNELRSMAPVDGIIKTAIHFQKEENPTEVPEIELEGHRKGLDTGAFVAVRWKKT
jgi:ubiquinone/menaquinone biosynthesis C-methylase UbiE